jgi:hypothetical protein
VGHHTSAPCTSSFQSVGEWVQTRYTGIPRLLATQRVLGNTKNKNNKIPQKEVSRKMAKMVPREAAEIRSQSVMEEDDEFIEDDCSVDWASQPIYDTYLDEVVSSIHQVLNESPKREVFDLEVDFLGVDAILLKTFNQSYDEIYRAEMTFLSKSEGFFASTLGILIARGKCKARQEHGKPTWQGEMQGLQYKCGSVLMNKAIMFIMGCGLVVILRRGDWNELTGHPKDRGKDSSNSRQILSNLRRIM